MFSRKIAVGAVAVGGAAVALLGATSAYAAPASSVAISAGTASSGTTVAVTGTGAIQFKDTTTNALANCTSTNLPGSVKAGSGQAPAGVGTINPTSSSFSSCSTLGLPLTIAPSGTWKINALETTVSGSSTVSVSGILAHVNATSCNFDIGGSSATSGGTVTGTYVNGSGSTQSKITFASPAASTLKVYNLVKTPSTGTCLGNAVKANGEGISINGSTITITPNNSAQGPIIATVT